MITKVLVTVMTYPTLSERHLETVCTAGFREDGTWIRIYPIPLRLFETSDRQIAYHKWQWIEVDLEQDRRDTRPESYHIRDISTLRVLDRIDSKPNWSERLRWAMKGKVLYSDMSELLEQTKRNEVSLAVLKPTTILDMWVEKVKIDDKYWQRLKKAETKYKLEQSQLSLFDDHRQYRESFVFAENIPYHFKYKFITTDGKERNLMVEDWELASLYRNCRKTDDEETACRKVCDKYMGFAKDRDLYFFVGTNFKWHRLGSPDPYMIIGVFSPPKGTIIIPSLFDL